MGVAVEIEARQICDRFGRPASRHLARSHQPAESLGDLNVD